MTKKLLAALLSLSFILLAGCKNETVINNNYTGSDTDSNVSDGLVTNKEVDVGSDINIGDNDGNPSVTSNDSEPVGTIIWGEQKDYYPYFFTHLTDTQKTIYNNLFNAAVTLSTKEIFICKAEDYKKSDISIAYMALTTDYPDIFWLDGKYTILAYQEQDSKKILEYYVTLSYDRSYEQAVKESLELKEKVDKLVAEVKNFGILETEKYFHDYLCNNVEYNMEKDDDNYTAFGALVNGKAVCEGYSRAMLLLCRGAGINCTLVRGTADNGEQSDIPHMWNVVELYGKWYHVDVTWDDPIRESPDDTEPIYTYFNKPDSQMYKNHTPYLSLTNETLDQITDSNYNYYLPVCSER